MDKTSMRAASALIATLLLCAGAAHAQKAPAKKAAAAPAEVQVAAATPEQLHAARLVHMGTSQCEFKQSVHITPSEKHPGYVDLRHGNRTWLMKPVLSPTGAMRLEDVRGEVLYIQIANKSMLLNMRQGQRMVDDCVHEQQRAAAMAVKAAQAD
ncbi:hypothetical protein IS481_11885 [Caldimonas thermodepolymerans]|uniref:Uncharacterized protein n=1 Tax=Caldimonas thermodepolymerans TaxID=215580 RepID=A0A2S5T938_9BURK|nr:hypothetical protein [Caldimonas thermodepolymerans]PPE71442.1 hypothetical protein C1702_00100 [Caldimonas thermodepolymerans]QPC30470.1 hypothetical protein IS481_11885 [Caldimonas thermodepolymerans]RDI02947.1 hypothetical protein DES46_102376 [Caldimonas thermodepolymerans]UZG43237.1 hypothetical protein ONZ46_12590 [Caldimonas thermodepolymerans]